MLTIKKYKEIQLLQSISNNPNIYRREFSKYIFALSLITLANPTILFSEKKKSKKKKNKIWKDLRWVIASEIIAKILDELLSLSEEEQEKIDFDHEDCIDCGVCLREFPGDGTIGAAADSCPVNALRKEQ
ncbi:hypothetical protein CRU92_04680 [Arcobacter sp. FW59]|nr:hypothetical protein CRU92_04680 [Arcobacter sp. FW59]